jgi:hypothetical protein
MYQPPRHGSIGEHCPPFLVIPSASGVECFNYLSSQLTTNYIDQWTIIGKWSHCILYVAGDSAVVWCLTSRCIAPRLLTVNNNSIHHL